MNIVTIRNMVLKNEKQLENFKKEQRNIVEKIKKIEEENRKLLGIIKRQEEVDADVASILSAKKKVETNTNTTKTVQDNSSGKVTNDR